MTTESATDIGRRPTNEDYAATAQLTARSGDLPWVWVAAVADGIGGNAAGEIASQAAVETFILAVQSALAEGISDPGQLVERGFAEANAAVRRRGESGPEHSGLGTTLTVGVLFGRRLWIGHVGDSRAYLVGRAGARQLTQDHAIQGRLTRYLGANPTPTPDILYEDMQDGDVAVLCTDGLYRQVGAPGIAVGVRSSRDISETCAKLVATAKELDGSDNITAACIAVGRRAFRESHTWRVPLSILLLAVLIAMGFVIHAMLPPKGNARTPAENVTADPAVQAKPFSFEVAVRDGGIEFAEGRAASGAARADPGADRRGRGALRDQKVCIDLTPDGKTGCLLRFERTGAKPRQLGYWTDGGELRQDSPVTIRQPRESISFYLAGPPGGADIPISIMLNPERRETTTEAVKSATRSAGGRKHGKDSTSTDSKDR